MAFIEITQKIEKAAWSMPDLHSHSHYELYFLEQGERSFFIDSTLYLIKPNTVVLVAPYVMHKTEGGPFSRIIVDFADSFFDSDEEKILSELGDICVFPLDNDKGAIIHQIMSTMLEEENNHNRNNHNAIKLFVKTVIGYLYLFKETADNAQKVSGNGNIRPQTLNMIKYINDNCKKKLTIEEIAKEFSVSESCLAKSFKKETGYNIGEFILNARINEAKLLLSSTATPINEVSELLGFSSANYFGLIFKQKVGMSPIKYRHVRADS